MTCTTSSGTPRPAMPAAARIPADETATGSLRFSMCSAKRAAAIGDRQILAVHMKRK